MNYIKKIRSKLGKDKFIHPGARIIIENEKGEILFLTKRNRNGRVGVPAGGLEENETIEMCIRREVMEETGLILNTLEVIGISSHPKNETVTYPNGDTIQYFTIEFYSNDWSGNIEVNDQEEIQSAKFEPKEKYIELPINEQSVFESLEYYKKHRRIRLS